MTTVQPEWLLNHSTKEIHIAASKDARCELPHLDPQTEDLPGNWELTDDFDAAVAKGYNPCAKCVGTWAKE